MARRNRLYNSSDADANDATAEVMAWFSKFQPFMYDTNTHFKANFERLTTQRKWNHKLKRKRWIECQICAFSALYGHDADATKLEKWQDLCLEVQIDPVPVSITMCKKALGSRKVLVNLVNLIDHRMSGVPVIRFSNFDAFREYTQNDNLFPRKVAKEEGFINALLRRL